MKLKSRENGFKCNTRQKQVICIHYLKSMFIPRFVLGINFSMRGRSLYR
jgi:hypothetical protein